MKILPQNAAVEIIFFEEMTFMENENQIAYDDFKDEFFELAKKEVFNAFSQQIQKCVDAIGKGTYKSVQTGTFFGGYGQKKKTPHGVSPEEIDNYFPLGCSSIYLPLRNMDFMIVRSTEEIFPEKWTDYFAYLMPKKQVSIDYRSIKNWRDKFSFPDGFEFYLMSFDEFDKYSFSLDHIIEGYKYACIKDDDIVQYKPSFNTVDVDELFLLPVAKLPNSKSAVDFIVKVLFEYNFVPEIDKDLIYVFKELKLWYDKGYVSVKKKNFVFDMDSITQDVYEKAFGTPYSKKRKKLCKKCKAKIEEGASFCGECGSPVIDEKRCEHCGKDLPIVADMKFCPFCGEKLESEEMVKMMSVLKLYLENQKK